LIEWQGELLWCSSELNDAPPPAGRMEALQLATPHDQAESFFWDGELGFMFEDKFFVVNQNICSQYLSISAALKWSV
jgi:hypothetical protein